MSRRYTVEWVFNEGRVAVRDARHGNLICGIVELHKTVDGIGWKYYSRTQTGHSRKLHSSPLDIIASMRFGLKTSEIRSMLHATEDDEARVKLAETTIQSRKNRNRSLVRNSNPKAGATV